MPRTTDLHTYPTEFADLLIAAGKKPIELLFPTAEKRTRFRHRFYAYMKAVRTTDQRPDLKKLAETVQIAAVEGVLKLRIALSCDTWEGALLREQLPKEDLPRVLQPQIEVSEEAKAAFQAKLAEIRARNEP